MFSVKSLPSYLQNVTEFILLHKNSQVVVLKNIRLLFSYLSNKIKDTTVFLELLKMSIPHKFKMVPQIQIK